MIPNKFSGGYLRISPKMFIKGDDGSFFFYCQINNRIICSGKAIFLNSFNIVSGFEKMRYKRGACLEVWNT
ncbi:MAG: hypothetical protein E3K40_09225 [Candidatus Brocadia sp.]|nr:hypothetical protein [Candidatus Brocadia sp.]